MREGQLMAKLTKSLTAGKEFIFTGGAGFIPNEDIKGFFLSSRLAFEIALREIDRHGAAARCSRMRLACSCSSGRAFLNQAPGCHLAKVRSSF